MAELPPKMARSPTKTAKFSVRGQHSKSRCGVTKVLVKDLVTTRGLPKPLVPLRFLQVTAGPGSRGVGVGGVGGPEPR